MVRILIPHRFGKMVRVQIKNKEKREMEMEDMFSRKKPKAFYFTVNSNAIVRRKLWPPTNLITNENTAVQLDWIYVLSLVERKIDKTIFVALWVQFSIALQKKKRLYEGAMLWSVDSVFLSFGHFKSFPCTHINRYDENFTINTSLNHNCKVKLF